MSAQRLYLSDKWLVAEYTISDKSFLSPGGSPRIMLKELLWLPTTAIRRICARPHQVYKRWGIALLTIAMYNQRHQEARKLLSSVPRNRWRRWCSISELCTLEMMNAIISRGDLWTLRQVRAWRLYPTAAQILAGMHGMYHMTHESAMINWMIRYTYRILAPLERSPISMRYQAKLMLKELWACIPGSEHGRIASEVINHAATALQGYHLRPGLSVQAIFRESRALRRNTSL